MLYEQKKIKWQDFFYFKEALGVVYFSLFGCSPSCFWDVFADNYASQQIREVGRLTKKIRIYTCK